MNLFRTLLQLLLSIVVTAFSLCVVAQTEADAVKEIKAHREKQEGEFRDPQKSPLEKKDQRKFKTLNYFPINLKFRVKARFVKNEEPVLFKMRTSTTRLPEYTKYGEVHFELDSQKFRLEVYQSPELMNVAGYEDYLFIPFTDLTNGKETYDVGRYLEFKIPTSEDVMIDFNLCYNPYCSYGSTRYSCPIPPEVNSLRIEIMAGEKIYKINDH